MVLSSLIITAAGQSDNPQFAYPASLHGCRLVQPTPWGSWSCKAADICVSHCVLHERGLQSIGRLVRGLCAQHPMLAPPPCAEIHAWSVKRAKGWLVFHLTADMLWCPEPIHKGCQFIKCKNLSNLGLLISKTILNRQFLGMMNKRKE